MWSIRQQKREETKSKALLTLFKLMERFTNNLLNQSFKMIRAYSHDSEKQIMLKIFRKWTREYKIKRARNLIIKL